MFVDVAATAYSCGYWCMFLHVGGDDDAYDVSLNDSSDSDEAM